MRDLTDIKNQNCQNCHHLKHDKGFAHVPAVCFGCSKDPNKGEWNWNKEQISIPMESEK